MAASAALTISVRATSPEARAVVQRVLGNAAGASSASVDGAGTQATVLLQLPGNISKLMRSLWATGVSSAQTIGVAVPVRKQAEHPIDAAALAGILNASPAISGAAFDGSTVSATIAATTAAMRFLFEEIIVAGLMPVDHPTPAGPQEFVL